jgi:hypothetical protein
MHTVTLTLVDLTPLPLVSARVSLDRDSATWSASLTLGATAALADIRPTVSGPVEVILTIDGYAWRLFAESVDEGRGHGSRTVSVSCRGLTAELGAPYQPGRAWTSDALYTGQQLIDRELPVEWGGSTWGLDWLASEWTIPAGAWSYADQTPLGAIGEVAGAIGARIVPAQSTRAIVVAPRYPILPWDWGAATPDRTLATADILNVTTRWVGGAAHDAIVVHGTSTGGVIGLVKRTGAAGTAPLAPASHPLITTAQAIRERGAQALAAAAGPAIEVTVTLPLAPVGSSPELLAVGELVEVADQTETWIGMVTGVQVTAQVGAVRQSVTIERRS